MALAQDGIHLNFAARLSNYVGPPQIDANRTASTSIKLGQYSFAANNANGIRNVTMKTNPPTQGMNLNIVRLYRKHASLQTTPASSSSSIASSPLWFGDALFFARYLSTSLILREMSFFLAITLTIKVVLYDVMGNRCIEPFGLSHLVPWRIIFVSDL